ncbi:ABC-2 type transport system permease protein [Streptoalloteichus tenebrarius]|uniref:ABC-2 type transport system permease protein n=1 Tax=Streptoalloteichus tenebrarius (strain ATCC 17920 / DSM 40477 / JCM 4838 / CBS 697.72 / NBRC 16177 / NCIMB 11028 / NRRL B-12390 / A12253. 1 / ISP 5477) TaxID=1933 RepID=A0ABT1I3X0_STRSD|nr:ABC transporter permease [Streptoalloteichus tenebrarius]MCP2262459.1 ABC-2 type transport system permease protein [Streptoalloteichus tenebrarius]BFF01333.1 ABC transporter permease [Streptoalloteichus tenebrarius]
MTAPTSPSGSTALSPARGVMLVARRELRTRLRSRSFVIGTIITIAVIAAYVGFMYFMGSSSSHVNVGLTGQATAVAEPLKTASKAMGKEVDTQSVSDPATGERMVRDGDLDALVVGAPGALKVVVQKEISDELRAALDGLTRQQALDARLAEAGLNPVDVNREVANARVTVSTLEVPDPQQDQRKVLAFASLFLLFFSVQTFGSMVAQGVVEEKSSRVVEILLSTVRPWQLMVGKVLGIGLVGLVQLVIIGGVALGAAIGADVLTLPDAAVGTLASVLGWYLIGFFLYAMILAASAALVSRQEELGSVLTPVLMLLMVSFFVGFTLLRNPGNKLVEVLSLIPPFGPVLMPSRIALGVAPAWQIALSVGLTVLAVVGIAWLGGRIYANAVLRTGGRVKLREALRTE